MPLFIPQRVAVHHSASSRRTTWAQIWDWHTDPRETPPGSGRFNYGGEKGLTLDQIPSHLRHRPRRRGNGWGQGGYNYVIGERGDGIPMRIVPERASAVARNNTGTLSICVVGHNELVIPKGKPLHTILHRDRRWTQQQVDGLRIYLDALLVIWPHLEGKVFGHRDVTKPGHPSTCPGLDIAGLIACDWTVNRYWDTISA